MATSRDVAKRAGVSPATVSRVFRREKTVTSETCERVWAAARELGYSPNLMASALKKRKSQIIGLLLRDADNPFHFNMARIIEKLLHRKGYRLIISFHDTDLRSFRQSLSMMASSQVQGVIFMPDRAFLPDEKQLALLKKNNGMQFLQLYAPIFPALHTIQYHDIAATHQATSYLLDHGHRKILFVGGAGRTEGFFDAYRDKGLEPPIPPSGIGLYDSQDGVYRQLLSCVKEQRPTCIFCVGNKFGGATLQVLKDLDLIFPRDISLLMFDDQDWARWLNITVVAHPVEETARLIVDTILKLCDNPDAKEQLEVPYLSPYLVVRGSVSDVS